MECVIIYIVKNDTVKYPFLVLDSFGKNLYSCAFYIVLVMSCMSSIIILFV